MRIAVRRLEAMRHLNELLEVLNDLQDVASGVCLSIFEKELFFHCFCLFEGNGLNGIFCMQFISIT